ncbi:hypothetical protein GH5_06165 [Leishmania sp. Ghana 2012 LV757]|uniref:hypothetical protein n=1 Tax=Leishmania sp. Ghana 2012 LV757 TaxID=2803181 RepID=UPI001B49569D|nr:hypothetical protein GH5_06165 [Leishmania sp. Ghana 2012 LV757]
MAQSSYYPPERRTLRVLELACPGSDAELRENCAYLVSQRRMTIDEAIDYVRSEAEKHKSVVTTVSLTMASPRARATTASATRITLAAPGGAPAASLEGLPRLNFPPSSSSRSCACEGEGNDAGHDNGRRSRYHGYRPPRTQPSVTAEGTMPATRALPVSSTPATAPPMPVEARNGNRTLARDTTPRHYTQPIAALTVTPPANEASPQPLLKEQGERRISGGTTGGVVEPRVVPLSSCSRGRVDESIKELSRLCGASLPILQEEDQELTGPSAPHVLVPPAVSRGCEPASAASDVRLPPASRPERDARDGGAAVTRASPSSTAAFPQRRPLPSWSAAVPSSTYPDCSESVADDDAVRKAAGHADSDEGCCDPEPLLSELKQATEEERVAFEAQQADMMYYWYRNDTSMFDHCLSRYGPGQVLFFTTSMTGERAVRDRCRLMENLLFVKLIPHHTMDIADSEFFHRRVRRLYRSATKRESMPQMPLLFVDTKLIGDYVTVQELEDSGELDAKMIEAGCRVLRQRVVDAYRRKKAGLTIAPLVLPANKRPGSKSTESGRPCPTPPVGSFRCNAMRPAALSPVVDS